MGDVTSGDLAALAAGIADLLKAPVRHKDVFRVCAACAAVLPCDGTSMTVMTSDVGRETVYASDGVIERFERTQYTLGEGPSLLAFTSRRPVLVPDLAHRQAASRWPGLATEAVTLPIGAIFCFPMRFGAISVGVCSLYRQSASRLGPDNLAFVLGAVDLTTLATGMLIAQLGVNAEQAFARLRGYAFLDGRDIEAIADDIVNRRLRLEPDPV
jgi:hypothetical protein